MKEEAELEYDDNPMEVIDKVNVLLFKKGLELVTEDSEDETVLVYLEEEKK